MLAFARRQELTFERIDVPDLVRGMTDLLGRSWQAGDLGIVVRMQEACAPEGS